MKTTRILLIAAVCTLAAASGAYAGEQPLKELRIVFIAYQNPEQIMDDVRPVVAYLKKSLGIPVKHFVATVRARVRRPTGPGYSQFVHTSRTKSLSTSNPSWMLGRLISLKSFLS